MSLPPLFPIAAAVFQPLADRALDGLAHGLSFLDVLRQHQQAPESPPTDGSNGAAVDLDAFLDQLRQRWSSLGIDTATPIRLKADGDGGVIVDGDHVDRVLIEGLFATDQDLTEQFHAVAELAATRLELDDRYRAEDFRLEIDAQNVAIDFV